MDEPTDIDTMIDYLNQRITTARGRRTQLIAEARETLGWWCTESTMRELLAIQAADGRNAELHNSIAQHEDDAKAAMAAICELDVEYQQRPWSRYYLTTGPNPHIHASTRCTTCRNTTRYRWLTSHSGGTPADVVAEHGSMLCRRCFPDVPASWWKPRRYCPGIYPRPDSVMHWSRSSSGVCDICRHAVRLKRDGTMIKHQAAGQHQ
jgi:hypothetical protein